TQFRLRHMLSRRFATSHWLLFLQTVPTFGILFGLACGVDFSINSALKEAYGPAAGLSASALTCSVFLTSADHLMFRKDKGVGYMDSMRYFMNRNHSRFLFTGYTPMVGREFLFGLSILYTGPLFGDYLKTRCVKSDDRALDLVWPFIGTFLSAMVTTTVSQPLDSLAREMQKIYHFSNGQVSPRFIDVAKNNMNLKTLYRGFAPRLVLASLGGATATTAFKYLKG
ncbi:MAG: MC/SLC25 family protein, partial [Solirubrobacteraceae bacterium]|nr:MC/SLC25 family protein [Solirubrobacteraceae bacterium]